VERVFAQHPALAMTAAVGVTSEVGEQEILIYLLASEEGEREDIETLGPRLAAWGSERLASFQVPRYYRWVDGFDLTPSQRIRKHLLTRDVADAWDRRRPLPLPATAPTSAEPAR
jgi:crotonobetaine/carnitine-CoA ligase